MRHFGPGFIIIHGLDCLLSKREVTKYRVMIDNITDHIALCIALFIVHLTCLMSCTLLIDMFQNETALKYV